jgi:glycosyltransferase involved in cell wall biosynthesis
LRVLHITPYFAPAFCYGGPPRSILGLTQALRCAGVGTDVFTTTANGKTDLIPSLVRGDIYESIPVHYFPRAFPRRFFRAKGLSEALVNVINDYDLLHLHGLWNFTVWSAVRQAKNNGLPFIISPRGMLDNGSMTHHAWRKRLAYHVLERNNLLAAAGLHATSTTEADVLKSYGFNNVFVIPNGVEDSPTSSRTTNELKGKLGLNCFDKLIVFLGRIHPIKRLDLLAQAFIQINQQVPEARLIIAGPDENNFKKLIEPLFEPIRESIFWFGEIGQKEKWELLRMADAFVACSDSESFGLSIAEAMFAGAPLVVTRTCPWDVIEKVGCGYWVEQNSVAIADAMIQLLTNQAEAKSMGERGKVYAKENFSWAPIAERMAECYQRTIIASTLSKKK